MTDLADNIAELLLKRNGTLSVAESCTGGAIGKRLTDIPGASQFFKGGIIAYSNDIKKEVLGVNPQLLEKYGAVSEPVAREMSEKVHRLFRTDWAIAVTGIAGPTGGTAQKPVGLVYIAVTGPTGTRVTRELFNNIPSDHPFKSDREFIRNSTVIRALQFIGAFLS